MGDKIDRTALWGMGYGMYIVSAAAEGSFNGQVANTVFQITNNPPRIAAAISKSNLTHEFIKKAGSFAVTILEESTPLIFIGLFGYRSGRVINKFEKTGFEIGLTGAPMVTEHGIALMELKLISEIDCGTHTLFVGDVITARRLNEATPLTYKYYREIIKGNTPIDSPTYIPPEKTAGV